MLTYTQPAPSHGNHNGYVIIPKNHAVLSGPFANINSGNYFMEAAIIDLDVHGGITFYRRVTDASLWKDCPITVENVGDVVIGFDTVDYGDEPGTWSAARSLAEANRLAGQIEALTKGGVIQ